ncbi:recombinase family protein [Alteribacter keqinensis]|uniref:Recombinase family protein n=1 Tax=Alteribacter keqinensis TaxID=2483800 RepID=A0A3M7TSH2_9BACI|nr:recombinase family protein [Alteribacter keqinensis]RNA68546.1 recombinase family protein [Alteribacter keqinensis]
MKKTALYVRQSLEKDKQKMSIDMQKSVCIEWADKNGYQISKVYQDYNVSGLKTKIEDRNGLSELLRDIEGGFVENVIVYKRDRLARDVQQYLEIYERFKDEKVHIHFTADNEPPLFQGPVGELLELVISGVAQYEGENINKKLIDSRIAKVKMSVDNKKIYWGGGTLPFGFVSKDGVLQHINDEAVEKIRCVFETFSRGVLADEGNISIPIPSLTEAAKHLRFKDASQVESIVKNRIHTGYVVQRIGKFTAEHFFKDFRVVDEETFQRAQEIYNSFKRGKVSRKSPPIITCEFICEECHSPMAFKKDNQMYRCENKPRAHKTHQNDLENAVRNQVLSYLVKLLKVNKRYVHKELAKLLSNEMDSKIDTYKKEREEKVSELKRYVEWDIKRKKPFRKVDLNKTYRIVSMCEKRFNVLLKEKKKIKKWIDKHSIDLTSVESLPMKVQEKAFDHIATVTFSPKSGIKCIFINHNYSDGEEIG